jgi:hypothetical protein
MLNLTHVSLSGSATEAPMFNFSPLSGPGFSDGDSPENPHG